MSSTFRDEDSFDPSLIVWTRDKIYKCYILYIAVYRIRHFNNELALCIVIYYYTLQTYIIYNTRIEGD